MAGEVKRRYDSPLRREQAAATRRAILDAAERCFARDGYAQTTMAAVARAAGVALKTVYVAFETKAGLLRALWNARLRGPDDVPTMHEHPDVLAVLADADPVRALERNARNSRLGKERIGALTEVVRAGAMVDDQVAGLWERINSEYRGLQRKVVERVAETGALAGDVERATDVLWTINHPGTWQLLVGQRGWSPDEYERWAARAAVSLLLAQDGVQR